MGNDANKFNNWKVGKSGQLQQRLQISIDQNVGRIGVGREMKKAPVLEEMAWTGQVVRWT